jgi:hypothetical protein
MRMAADAESEEAAGQRKAFATALGRLPKLEAGGPSQLGSLLRPWPCCSFQSFHNLWNPFVD